MTSEPSPEEIVRVEEWQQTQKKVQRQEYQLVREQRAAKAQQHLSNALVGKTVERVESDAEDLNEMVGYDNYSAFDIALLFTDGSSISLEATFESAVLDISVKPSTKPE